MPGVGDFNLRSFFRAMGIKNPDTSMREFVQPVILVGDMSEITPQYRPPRGIFGGDVAATVGEFSTIQMTSRAEGGTLLGCGADTVLRYATITPRLIDTDKTADVVPACQFSVEAPVSLVGTGGVILLPGVTLQSPSTDTDFNLQEQRRYFWVRPGDTFAMWAIVANTSINRWWMDVIDLPASENSIL